MFTILSICKGGGYRYCRTDPPHPKANAKGLYPLHRVVAENRLGRLLHDDETVHHIDGDKCNDRPSNLDVIDRSGHSRLHWLQRRSEVHLVCPICGNEFIRRAHAFRLAKRRSKSGNLFCSRRCAAIAQHRSSH